MSQNEEDIHEQPRAAAAVRGSETLSSASESTRDASSPSPPAAMVVAPAGHGLPAAAAATGVGGVAVGGGLSTSVAGVETPLRPSFVISSEDKRRSSCMKLAELDKIGSKLNAGIAERQAAKDGIARVFSTVAIVGMAAACAALLVSSVFVSPWAPGARLNTLDTPVLMSYLRALSSTLLACSFLVLCMGTDGLPFEKVLDAGGNEKPWTRRGAYVFFACYFAKDAFVGPYYVFAVPAGIWLVCGVWREFKGIQLCGGRVCVWVPCMAALVAVNTCVGLLVCHAVWYADLAWCHLGWVRATDNNGAAAAASFANGSSSTNGTGSSPPSSSRCSALHGSLPHDLRVGGGDGGGGGDAEDHAATQGALFGVSAVFCAVGAGAILCIWWRSRVQHWQTLGSEGGSAAQAMHGALWLFCGIFGSNYLYQGCWRLTMGLDDGLPHLLEGLGLLAPSLVVARWGSSFVFGMFIRRFDRARGEIDGAMMAEILDSQYVHVGDEWWVHRQTHNIAPPGIMERSSTTSFKVSVSEFSMPTVFTGAASFVKFGKKTSVEQHRQQEAQESHHEQEWAKGVVANRDELGGRFTVFWGEMKELKSGRITQSGANERRASTGRRTSTSNGGNIRGGTRSGVFGRRNSVVPQSDTNDKYVWVPLPLHDDEKSAKNLLREARASLRCIDARNLSFQLFRSSSSSVSVGMDNATLSRPVTGASERIDYFISHSWSDNATEKWARLNQVLECYQHNNGGRHATFWLDKVCINQKHIDDGLKLLVINVMSCDKLLMVCGKTYSKRLWCVLELFMLFAFGDEDTAFDRIEFVPILEDSIALDSTGTHIHTRVTFDSLCKDLENFDLNEAHCYDPNEEARIRNVMRKVGEDRFTKRIQMLGARVRARGPTSYAYTVKKEQPSLAATRWHQSFHKLKRVASQGGNTISLGDKASKSTHKSTSLARQISHVRFNHGLRWGDEPVPVGQQKTIWQKSPKSPSAIFSEKIRAVGSFLGKAGSPRKSDSSQVAPAPAPNTARDEPGGSPRRKKSNTTYF